DPRVAARAAAEEGAVVHAACAGKRGIRLMTPSGGCLTASQMLMSQTLLSGGGGADVEHATALNGLELTSTARNCTVVICVESVSAGHGAWRGDLADIR